LLADLVSDLLENFFFLGDFLGDLPDDLLLDDLPGDLLLDSLPVNGAEKDDDSAEGEDAEDAEAEVEVAVMEEGAASVVARGELGGVRASAGVVYTVRGLLGGVAVYVCVCVGVARANGESSERTQWVAPLLLATPLTHPSALALLPSRSGVLLVGGVEERGVGSLERSRWKARPAAAAAAAAAVRRLSLGERTSGERCECG
jgi:hypothetical protein